MKLKKSFYLRPDVVAIARELLGKVLFSRVDGEVTAGIITETEAYNGIIDRASHAYGDRRTMRTEIMYAEGGSAYIYLCYGIHSLFNVVTNVKNVPHAVLIRSILPYKNEKLMLQRRGSEKYNKGIFTGPGKVCQALALHYSMSGTSLLGNVIWIEDKGISYNDESVMVTARIGVDYAGNDALLPYRFVAF
jgi:DNA-3-methyladenine glycosylase